ncbi:hypothetical protein G5V59_02890 [Nocardioides sp. W3-2-3]|uniref:SipW-dependent-type signal peptide-containing protein n=1 Tax=Nocardioides convexus TaxID=2712224 RepID=UPI00241850BB|nr:SipW-dependent-type signal peptide-containing protein [Nocardioides convexus]NGZ99687.1 hypothetical protein [Nocardioides convexus]
MKKTTKGALAAGSAAVLLMGGAGTLAYWSANTSVAGVNVTAGEPEDHQRHLRDGELGVRQRRDRRQQDLRPGDRSDRAGRQSLTKTCAFTIRATGEHLRANVALTNPALSGALASSLTLDTSFKVGGVDLTTADITEANNNNTVNVVIGVTFNGGVAGDNASQTLSGALSQFAIQTRPGPQLNCASRWLSRSGRPPAG